MHFSTDFGTSFRCSYRVYLEIPLKQSQKFFLEVSPGITYNTFRSSVRDSLKKIFRNLFIYYRSYTSRNYHRFYSLVYLKKQNTCTDFSRSARYSFKANINLLVFNSSKRCTKSRKPQIYLFSAFCENCFKNFPREYLENFTRNSFRYFSRYSLIHSLEGCSMYSIISLEKPAEIPCGII